MLPRKQCVLKLLENLGEKALVANTPGITHFHDSSLFTFSEHDMLLMMYSVDAFAKNDPKVALSFANFFKQ